MKCRGNLVLSLLLVLATLSIWAGPPCLTSVSLPLPEECESLAALPAPQSRTTPGVPYRESALAGKARVLLLESLHIPEPFLTDLAFSYPDTVALVDSFDLVGGTPTLAQLSAYDVVIFAANAFIADGATLGDRLADYVDMGGKVILTPAAWTPGGWTIGGRFASGGYLPFLSADTRNFAGRTLGATDPNYPLFGGVTTLGATFTTTPTPVPGTYVAGRWDNDAPLAAVKGPVVALNLLPEVQGGPFVTGDASALFLNAISLLMTPRLRVLLAPSDSYPSQLAGELVRDPRISSVDFLDASVTTPSVADLARYDVVITWPNWPFADRVLLGDRLADYADIGGKVILGGFCWYTHGFSLGGAIITGGYSPLDGTTGNNHYAEANLGSYDGSNPILWGVSSASSPFRDYTALAPGATLVAGWDDGENFVAAKGNVVAINAGLMDGGFSGDVPLLVHNAAKYLALVYAWPTASSFIGSAPLTVTFTGSATGGQPPYTYRWDFADGSSSAEQNPVHTFTAPGSYNVVLSVTDSQGHEGSTGFLVQVGAPLSLTASGTPTSGTAPLAVSFSSSPTGGTPPYAFDWNFGDGTAHGTTQNPTHTFSSGGVFTTVLTVTDAQGHTASRTLTTIVNPALQAFAGGAPASGHAPLTTNFFGFAAGGTPPYTYAWAFSDGGSASGASVSHTFASAGSYTATLTVTDAASRTATASPVSVTVTVPPPVISSLTKKGNPFRIIVSGSNLQSGIQVFINGNLWSNVTYQSTNQITLKGGSSLKTAVPPGTPTTFRFVNPDSGQATVVWSY
jgi:PKD repeat protein